MQQPFEKNGGIVWKISNILNMCILNRHQFMQYVSLQIMKEK